jgi:hypothetical protein
LRDKELKLIRRETDDKGPHADGEDSRRLGTDTRQRRRGLGRNWPKPADTDRPARPISRPNRPPFDLAAIQAIYSPEARRHASTHSPSATEEQRREGHHLGEERVELVD